MCLSFLVFSSESGCHRVILNKGALKKGSMYRLDVGGDAV